MQRGRLLLSITPSLEGLRGGVSLRRRGAGSGPSAAGGYLVEADHASYVLLTTHGIWCSYGFTTAEAPRGGGGVGPVGPAEYQAGHSFWQHLHSGSSGGFLWAASNCL